jgi:hypothetical protein
VDAIVEVERDTLGVAGRPAEWAATTGS